MGPSAPQLPESELYERLKNKLLPGAVLEIGDGSFGLHCGASVQHTVLSLVASEHIDSVTRHQREHDVPNLLVAEITPDQLPALSRKLLYNPQTVFRTVVISNLTALVGSLLPHEFEIMLARFLVQSTEMYFAHPPSSMCVRGVRVRARTHSSTTPL